MKINIVLLLFIWISLPSFAQITAALSNPSGKDCPDGAIDLSVLGGVAPYTYSWSGPDSYTAHTEDIDNLQAGHYQVTVTDKYCGTATALFHLTIQQGNIGVSLEYRHHVTECSPENVSCDGALHLYSVSASYTYQWSGPNGFSATTQDIDGLCVGTYIVKIYKNPKCDPVEIKYEICCCYKDNEPQQHPDPTYEALCEVGEVPDVKIIGQHVTPIIASQNQSGVIDIDVVGSQPGLLDLTYQWTGPNGFTSNQQDIGPVTQTGTYCVTISNGCKEATSCWSMHDCVAQPISLNTATQDACLDPFDNSALIPSSIVITPGGAGDSPFTFLWNTGAAIGSLVSIPAGNYCVTVTDNVNCTAQTCTNVASEDAEAGETAMDCTVPLECPNGMMFLHDIGILSDITNECCTEIITCANGQTFETNYTIYEDRVNADCIGETSCSNGITVSLGQGVPYEVNSSSVPCAIDVYCIFRASCQPISWLVFQGTQLYPNATITCYSNFGGGGCVIGVDCDGVPGTDAFLEPDPWGFDFDCGDFSELGLLPCYAALNEPTPTSTMEGIKGVVLSATPNPFIESLQVVLTLEVQGEVTMSLTSVSGNVLSRIVLEGNVGINVYRMSVDTPIPDGTYILSATLPDNSVYSVPVVKHAH